MVYQTDAGRLLQRGWMGPAADVGAGGTRGFGVVSFALSPSLSVCGPGRDCAAPGKTESPEVLQVEIPLLAEVSWGNVSNLGYLRSLEKATPL